MYRTAVVSDQIEPCSRATTSGSVGPSGACMCGNGCMSRAGGFQAVRAEGENSQIRTLLKKTII